jgi:hypothetical protein
MCFLAFGIGDVAGLSFFKLLTESKAIFMLSRVWSTASLLNKSKVNCSLVKGNGSRNEVCNSTDIGIGVPVRLTSLAMRVEGLFNGRR